MRHRSLLCCLTLLFGCVARAAVISAGTQTAVAGQTLVIPLSFAAEGPNVSGLQFDLEWDSPLDVKTAIGTRLRTSTQVLYAASRGTRQTRTLLISPNGDAIPDGEIVRLFVVVDGSAPAGATQLRLTNAIGTDVNGNPVTIQVTDVNVEIQGSASTASQPNSNWNTPLVQIKFPAPVANAKFGIRGIAIGPDGYAYVGSSAGVYRAQTTCIAADASNAGCWFAINSGAPAAFQGPDPYLAATNFDFMAGKVYATWLDSLSGNYGKVCSWSPANPAWSCNKPQTPDLFARGTGYITHDGNNNLYAGIFSIAKSTDGGATWADQTKGDAYGSIGLRSGILYDVKVWNGSIYWGGEGPLIKQPLNFSSFQNVLHTAVGGCSNPNCYAHNMRGTIADGDAATGIQSEMLALINHCNNDPVPGSCSTGGSGYIQRFNAATNTWSPAADATYSGGTTHDWTIRRLAQGFAPHEYYAVGGGGLGGATGVMGSVDGGATWTMLGKGQTWSVPSNDGALSLIAVSPVDDAKIVARQTDAWFHPGPGGSGGGSPGPPPITSDALVNAASLAGGTIAPGEIVTFFGTVPSAPVLAFNGKTAPVLYAGAGQLNAIVPFGLDVSAPASVELRNNGQVTASGSLPIAPVAPAIFTQNGSGAGAGSILNQDYSVNSPANPAAPGSYIMIYGTGFGALSPAAQDGQLAGGVASTVLPVSATIGGVAVPAGDVVYAGAAPGLIAGVVQVNVKIPAGLRTTPAASVVLTVGGVSTPPGVTVSIQ